VSVTARITSGAVPLIAYRPKLGTNQRVVRLSIVVPVEVDASEWELTYGIEQDSAALVSDVRDHVRTTVEDAVRTALAAQASGAVIR
jgi:hypothetical protein